MYAQGYIAACITILTIPTTAQAGDLAAALDYVAVNAPGAQNQQLAHLSAPDSHDALAFLIARDTPTDKPLEDYDCLETSRIDGTPGLSPSWTQNRRTARHCVMLQWRRDKVKGFVTLGDVQLQLEDVEPWLDVAAQENKLHPYLLRAMIELQSGYRPGLISEDGKVGIMQLTPEIARQYGAINPMDPQQSILAGARYLGALYDSYGVLELALAHYRAGPDAVIDGHVAGVPSVMWFVRAVRWEYKVNTDEFPVEHGWEHIAFVMTWLE